MTFDNSSHQLDRDDPLGSFREYFLPTEEGIIYLDGNSLGRPPIAVAEAVSELIQQQWATELVRGWDDWINLPQQVGDLLAASVLGARPGEVLLGDSTSVNLYKLAAAALASAKPGRRVLVTDNDNFPTDRYILNGLAQHYGAELRLIDTDINAGVSPDDVAKAVGDDTAVVCLSHVAYRSGALADLPAITKIAHDAGARMLWDLCHSAGSVPIDLAEHNVDLAVGCTYKYLNAGPGAPAFLYVRQDLIQELTQPIWGWFSQSDQFAMGESYKPTDTINRFAVGTPHIAGIIAVKAASSIIAKAGITQIREKSVALTTHALSLADELLAQHGFRVVTPRDAKKRGGHITLEHENAWQISQALRAHQVIPDYRSPNRIRLGFAPLYNSFDEINRAFKILANIVETRGFDSYDHIHTTVT